MARAATSPELAIYRTPGKWSVLRCAILTPPIVYRARINQTFSSLDQVISIIYDTGSGTLANVLPDMEVWIGSSVDAHDKGICRLRDKDATHFYISGTSEIAFSDNDYVTILAGFGVWARPARIIADGTVYMDETAYTDQHTSWDPMPNMGPHKVAELTGASVNVGFTASSSFCPGSSISAYAWSCATASASAGTTTDTCTLQFNTTGWHIVYLTVTAANSKSFFGVRYVYIWDQDNPPPLAEIINPGHCDVDSGGWQIELRLYDADLADIYDRAMVILFSEDHYGDTVQAIGPVAGAENIRFIGWVSGEAHHLESEQGSVTFQAHGAAYWMTRIPSWPDGVEWVSGTLSWTSVQNPTIDLGVYHFLRWRSTATRVMDVTLSGDTRLTQEVSYSSQNLWAQLQEMAWIKIYARPGVNALNQFSLHVHPSLIPTGDRVHPTVMAITKADYQDGLDFDREIVNEVGIVDMSGVVVSAPNTGQAYFALAPGHALPHYGDWDIQPDLLISSQAQVITLAGLYRAWKNNPFKSIPIAFDAQIALIDCFPNQKCTIDLQAADNVRGFAYSGGLIPVSVDLVQDPETGYLHTEVTFEAETAESRSIQGETPGSGGTTGPVTPSFPPLPDFPVIIPGLPTPTAAGPTRLIVHDTNFGFCLTDDFDASSPAWITINAGLTATQLQGANFMFVCPNGSFYVGKAGTIGAAGVGSGNGPWIARAPTVGGTFVIVEDEVSLYAKYSSGLNMGIKGCACNPLVPEQVAYVMGEAGNMHIWVGSGTSFTEGAAADIHEALGNNGFSYGQNSWIYTGPSDDGGNPAKVYKFSANGASLISNPTFASIAYHKHVRASTTETIYISSAIPPLKTVDNGANWAAPGATFTGSVDGWACDPSGMFFMCQSGGKAKSSDGGATLVSMPSLPVGVWYFGYAGPGETYPRFVAVGATVYYSPDFGTTWFNRTGGLTSIVAIPSLDMVWVLEY